ncbi:paeninodin family lasso peptide [Peribacillus frigoritolerans]|jgi:hypothetical protein|nr:paeninodin family lasso peptide [Peribacillus frigoritolerans]KOR79795.1 recombinase RecA [Bacillus sp. FJAT-21352]MBD8134933.1 paeninodin family lasso peptide [Bacillus sp. CFBP 13597]PRS39076.1 paeninodin family lasso peptide [Bacillus sp. RJGP41]MDG4850631.1 paeninodin family lasso peptide [Peribacillus frigoritolerans]USK78794.1 paeninodin family lasso peptide [Peribacillus frigoritolerans]
MKKEWQTPKLEVLNINMTMGGPGIMIPDGVQNDPDEMVHHS